LRTPNEYTENVNWIVTYNAFLLDWNVNISLIATNTRFCCIVKSFAQRISWLTVAFRIEIVTERALKASIATNIAAALKKINAWVSDTNVILELMTYQTRKAFSISQVISLTTIRAFNATGVDNVISELALNTNVRLHPIAIWPSCLSTGKRRSLTH